ncbi:MAG: flagellar biosynthesis protein FliC [Cellvibrio sp.]|nr:flagellar biosynthesis protein FliC [Cellvibrio sp.]
MALVINTNVASLNAQRQLNGSGMALDRATERLSSGQRVNSAKDDAAGLAISNRMTSQVRGLDQAVRNANDGVSLIQTAEGALQESTNILQRMRELAVQSSNGIYNDADRSTLNAESKQLKAELDRIASSTSFNGQNLLDGTLGTTKLQVGAFSGQTMDLSVGNFKTGSMGGSSADIVGAASTGIVAALTTMVAAFWTINDKAIGTLAGGTTLNDKLKLLNADANTVGVNASTLVEKTADNVGTGILVAGTDTFTITTVDGDGNTQSDVITGTSSMQDLVNKINENTAVTAKLNTDGKLVLSKEGAVSIATVDNTTNDGSSGITDATFQARLVLTDTSSEKNGVKVERGGSGTAAAEAALGINVSDDNGNIQSATVGGAAATMNEGDLIINGVAIKSITLVATAATNATEIIKKLNEQSAETGVVAFAGTETSGVALRSVSGGEISIKAGAGTTAALILARTGFKERNAAEGTGSVAGVDISTLAGAQKAIGVIDKAIDQVSSQRADLGAINNRLDFTVANLSNISEKTTAARSRIVDADFAVETANLSRSQVLQQASTAMLAQANARAQNVLSLLR